MDLSSAVLTAESRILGDIVSSRIKRWWIHARCDDILSATPDDVAFQVLHGDSPTRIMRQKTLIAGKQELANAQMWSQQSRFYLEHAIDPFLLAFYLAEWAMTEVEKKTINEIILLDQDGYTGRLGAFIQDYYRKDLPQLFLGKKSQKRYSLNTTDTDCDAVCCGECGY